jgi:tetratricopeptide (TPR) repeat protein
MSNTAQLRQKARSLEQREQWKPALEVYEQMVSAQVDGEDLDVGVWNRIGDLHMRLAQSDHAVSAYERAVQAYSDAGLHNNAIALCNKILRLTPGRPAIYLKLALISALKGFLADARQHLNQYLQRLNTAGQLEIGLQTLVANADSHSEDAAEVRRVVAEQLQAHGQTGEALRLFRAAHRVFVERGQAVEAERVLAQIEQCETRWVGDQAAAPATTPPPAEPVTQAEPAGEIDLELEIVSGDDPASPSPQQAGVSPSLVEAPAPDAPELEPGFELSDIGVLAGFESTALDSDVAEDVASIHAADGLEPLPSDGLDSGLEVTADPDDSLTILDFGQPSETDSEALPLLSFESDHHRREQLETELNLVAAEDGLLPAWVDDAEAHADADADSDGEMLDEDHLGPAASLEDERADVELGFDVETPVEPLPFLDPPPPTTAGAAQALAFESDPGTTKWDPGSARDDELDTPGPIGFDDAADPLPLLDFGDAADSESPAAPDDDGWFLPDRGTSSPARAAEEWDGSGAAGDDDSDGASGGDGFVPEPSVEVLAGSAAERTTEPLPSFLAEETAGERPASVAPERSEPPAEETGGLDALRAQVVATPEDRRAVERLRTRLRAVGVDDESRRTLDQAVQSLAERGQYAEGVAVLRVLLELTSADTPLYQRQVELAFRADDAELLIRAYLDLAAHLEADGEAAMVRAVYERVLELDADNQQARRALGFPEAPVAKAHAEGEYVDLAALIMEDEEQPSTTRFVVEAEEPSGDEDKDFAEILARFREQVAQNIAADDSASHYDLGVAFKEMGLFDEAISEFQTAIRAGANPLATLEVLGECFVAQQQYAVGWRVLDRAVRVSGASDAELVGVVYWMGRCDEELGRADAAAECYERVLSVDIRFRDTAERLRELRGSSSIPL